MKKLSLIITLLSLFTFANAQVVEVEITEMEKSMSQGLNSACIFTLENADKKDVEKSWGKFMKKYGKKTKKVKKSNDYLTDNATISGMSTNTIDVYASFAEKGKNNTTVSVWYNLGGAYLSSAMHPDRFLVAESMLNSFANLIAKQGVEDDLDNQEKMLKSLSGDLKSLEKKKENLESDIEKYQKKIEEARAEIEQNVVDQANKKEAIKNQEGVVEDVKSHLKKFN